jgi:hypothetical protein
MQSFRDGFDRPTIIISQDRPIPRSFYDGFARPMPIDTFSPKSIYGLEFWFDANKITGLSDGDAVSTWIDSSGNGNDLSQSNASYKPQYKTNILNGKPVVRFGGNDYLYNALFSGSQPSTIFIVWSISTTTASQNPIDSRNAGNRNDLFRSGSNYISINAGTALAGELSSGVLAHMIHALIFNGTSSAIYKNGSQTAFGNAGTQGMTGITLGASYADTAPLTGDIAEVFRYNSAFSSYNRKKGERYLSHKYGIALV